MPSASGFVTGLYRDVLLRLDAPSEVESTYLVDQLASGNVDRVQAATAFLNASERHEVQVDFLYRETLGRVAVELESKHWVGVLDSGVPIDEVTATFLGSAEYRAAHGPDNTDFVQALYRDALGRTASTDEVAYWSQVTARDGTILVAHAVVDSAEYRAGVVQSQYRTMLGRDGTREELTHWANAWSEFGFGEVGVAARFLAGSEYDTLPPDRILIGRLNLVPGQSGLAVTDLTDGSVVVRAGLNEHDRLAVGSTFKLFVLGRLVEEVNQGLRTPDDTTPLRPDLTEPNSVLNELPPGSPVSLYRLAELMISVSDNTATDHLLDLLGRENVEQQMAVMGHEKPEVNIPLLFTKEMIGLRDKHFPERLAEYRSLDVADQRALLFREFDGRAADYDAIDFDTTTFRLAEWYNSPLDSARVLLWLRDHTAPGLLANRLRGALDQSISHNPIEVDATLWDYVGYKGGNEDRLLAVNYLFLGRDGRSFTVNAAWNNPDRDIATGIVTPRILIAIQQLIHVFETDIVRAAANV